MKGEGPNGVMGVGGQHDWGETQGCVWCQPWHT